MDLFGIRGVESCKVLTRNQSRCQQERQQEKEWRTGVVIIMTPAYVYVYMLSIDSRHLKNNFYCRTCVYM